MGASPSLCVAPSEPGHRCLIDASWLSAGQVGQILSGPACRLPPSAAPKRCAPPAASAIMATGLAHRLTLRASVALG
eukprot:4887617-Pyramimonas_sp.AAC.2